MHIMNNNLKALCGFSLLSAFLIADYTPLYFLLISILFSFLDVEMKYKNGMFSIFVALFFSSINFQKLPSSDFLVYIDAIKAVGELSFFQVVNFSYVSLRSSEFIFNYYIWFLSLIDTSGGVFAFLSVFFIYFMYSLSITDLFEDAGNSKYWLIVSVLLFSITFSLTGHLVRQYMAAVVFFYGMVKLNKNITIGILLMAFSGFIHNSMFAFAILFPLVNAIFIRFEWRLVVLSAISFSLICSQFLYLLRPYMEIGFVKDDGSVPIALLAFDFSLFIIFSFLTIMFEGVKRRTHYIYSFVLLLVCCLIFTYDAKLLFLRFYFLMDFIRPIVIIYTIGCLNLERRLYWLVLLGLLPICMFVFLVRMQASPWDYGNDAVQIVFNTGIIDILERLKTIWW